MSSTIGKTPNEVVYEFTPNTALDLLNTVNSPEFLSTRTAAKDVIAFANINTKYHYNRHYQSIFLKIEDYVYLRLYKGYNILVNLGIIKKLAQQYIGPFKVLERVGRLVYLLEVFEDW